MRIPFYLIKQNKIVILLSLIILLLLFRPISGPVTFSTRSGEAGLPAPGNYSLAMPSSPVTALDSARMMESAPTPEVKERMVVSDSNLSLVVKNVTETQKQITDKAVALGGYMVTSTLTNPAETATATVVVRVPSKSLSEAITYFKEGSQKVVSEELMGDDVTDQYTDLEARLKTLNETKAKFEDIFRSATQVADILNVQREIINLQAQIDGVKGQQDYLKKTAENAKITVYLSKDELALPYSPTEVWRPKVVYKIAVRTLLTQLQNLGSGVIWAGVYSVIWLPILLIIRWVKRRNHG